MGGRDQSQVKIKFKKFEKVEVRSERRTKSHNDDMEERSEVMYCIGEGMYIYYRYITCHSCIA